ncbi:hypothetical protein [Tenacibaculum maritimum]|uniref:hypothetical protein n=1 Tax=Tenacibaculum maritimum TaxID=107401 RepID=UPI0023073628|nr:hypothetical protein [Tenacibaculum maritimum]MDB0600969.1 hypothetical protein [Tenacibaculum maritimum]MDB0611916.1 hypothetical protein [Tenacibaculum maritimum]
MKAIQLLFVFLTTIIFTSCTIDDGVDDLISLDELVSQYDLWYIDYHRTEGRGEVPFIAKSFTVSFFNGKMYANNNIVDIGKTGNGLGVLVGNYRAYNGVLEMSHRLDGTYGFEVVQLSSNEIRIDDISQNVSYFLIGYQRNNFDYDKLFYDNIEYFLQEYIAWERIGIEGGVADAFDDETYLQFTPEDTTTFYSSHDPFGTDIENIRWDFSGNYTIKDPIGTTNLKYLTLNYDNGDTEEFDLTVINDETIRLYNINSKTTYDFSGRGFVEYLRRDKQRTESPVRNEGRKRTKIKRAVVQKRN